MNRKPIAHRFLSLLLICHLSFISQYSSFGQTLSPSAQASLITYGPGDDDISSSFGHTEIRIYDPATGLDRDYSYGGFDYNADSFVLKFLRGTLPYQLTVHSLYQVIYYYQQTNRSIREQQLNLSPTQRQHLFAALEKNYLPQNREYRYKFYYDNCSTRPRDMIVEACGDSLTIPSRAQMTGKSYRDWMNDYLGGKPWSQLVMNLSIGKPADEQTDGWHAMYLPDQVHDQLVHAMLRQANGQVVPLIGGERTVLSAQKTFRKQVSLLFDPDVVFTILGIVVVVFTIRRYRVPGKVDRWIDLLLFSFTGFLGWVLFLLWVATDHGVTAWNSTLLYMMPLHLPLVYWATSSTTTARRRTFYFGITSVLILLGMILSKVPGGVDAVFPLTLLVRCIVNMQPVRLGRQTPMLID